MFYFFPPYTILGVGKNHDLKNKKWVTLGDAQYTEDMHEESKRFRIADRVRTELQFTHSQLLFITALYKIKKIIAIKSISNEAVVTSNLTRTNWRFL